MLGVFFKTTECAYMTLLIPLVRDNWNQLLTELRVFAQVADAMKNKTTGIELHCDFGTEYRQSA
jgi:hypothetical protein